MRNKVRLFARKHKQRVLDFSDHPLVIPVTAFLLCFMISAAAFVTLGGSTIRPSDSRVVRLYVDGKEQTLPTRAPTVGELLSRLDVQVGEHDVVEPARDAAITDDNFNVNIYRAQPVTIIDEGKKATTTFSAQQAGHDIVKQAGVTLYPEDKVEVKPPEDVLKEGVLGAKVVIDRAVPVKLNLYGVEYNVRTHASTVEEMVKERKIAYNHSSVFPAPDTALKPNDAIFVTHPGKQIVMNEEAIPPPEETVSDPNLPLGQQKVSAPGVDGKKVAIYELAPDGKKIPLQQVVVLEPVKKVVAKGAKVLNIAIAGDKSAVLSAAGVPASQHFAADFVIARESGWRLTAGSAGGCLGLGQACPGSKLVRACPNWQVDANCQIRFFTGYANGRYGSWQGAYNFWMAHHWW